MAKIDKARRQANRLSKMSLVEVSCVDSPAQELATLVLKRRNGDVALSFQPFFFQKGADEEPEDDEPEYGEEDMDDEEAAEREADARKRARTKALRKMVRDKFATFAKADDNDEGDLPDPNTRSAAERASDLAAVERAAAESPPAASETFPNWCGRVFGNQLANLDSAELRRARQCYDEMMQGSVLKRRASDALMMIAKGMHTADPSRTVYQHWAKAAHANPELYAAVKEYVPEPVAKSADNVDFGSFDASGGHGQGYKLIDNGYGAGADTRSALDVLNEHAADIRKASMASPRPLSAAQSFAKACALHPDLYAAHARGE